MRRTCKDVNRVFLLILFNMGIVPLFLGRLLLRMDTYGGTVVTIILYMIPVLLGAAATRGRCVREIPFSAPRLPVLLLVLLLAFFLLPVVAWLNMFSMMFSENHIAQELMTVEHQSLWKNMLFVALLPAVFEELAVRGVLYHGYRRAGILKGAVVSGLLFGIMHLNLNQFCYAAVLGIVLALLVEATGNIFYSMEVHFVINLNSVLLLHSQASAAGMELVAADEAAEALSSSPAWDELLFIWTFLSVFAVVCILLAGLVFVLTAKCCHRWDHMKAICNGSGGKNQEPPASLSPADKNENESETYRIVTPSLAIAVIFGIVYMIRMR